MMFGGLTVLFEVFFKVFSSGHTSFTPCRVNPLRWQCLGERNLHRDFFFFLKSFSLLLQPVESISCSNHCFVLAEALRNCCNRAMWMAVGTRKGTVSHPVSMTL